MLDALALLSSLSNAGKGDVRLDSIDLDCYLFIGFSIRDDHNESSFDNWERQQCRY